MVLNAEYGTKLDEALSQEATLLVPAVRELKRRIEEPIGPILDQEKKEVAIAESIEKVAESIAKNAFLSEKVDDPEFDLLTQKTHTRVKDTLVDFVAKGELPAFVVDFYEALTVFARLKKHFVGRTQLTPNEKHLLKLCTDRLEASTGSWSELQKIAAKAQAQLTLWDKLPVADGAKQKKQFETRTVDNSALGFLNHSIAWRMFEENDALPESVVTIKDKLIRLAAKIKSNQSLLPEDFSSLDELENEVKLQQVIAGSQDRLIASEWDVVLEGLKRIKLDNARRSAQKLEKESLIGPKASELPDDIYSDVTFILSELNNTFYNGDPYLYATELALKLAENPKQIKLEEKVFLRRYLTALSKLKLRYQLVRRNIDKFAVPVSDKHYLVSIPDALETYIDWVQSLIDLSPDVSSGPKTAFVEGRTLKEYMDSDIESLSFVEAYAFGKELWGPLFSDFTLTTSQQKVIYNDKYVLVIRRLEALGNKREAQYLSDVKEFHALSSIGRKSHFTMDHDAAMEGGAGWLGFNVSSQFNSGNYLRLLYGHDIDLSLNSPEASVEERDRVRAVNDILPIICDLYSEYNPVTKKKGKFHATRYFVDTLKAEFLEEIATRWKDNVLHLPPGQELNSLQQEAFKLAIDIHANLDIRSHYALPFYLAGWSPQDSIRDTIPKYASRYANGKTHYIICGKNKFMVDVALGVSQFSSSVDEAIESEDRENNHRFCIDIATPAYLGWGSEPLDQGEDGHPLPDDELLAFKRTPEHDDIVPSLATAFWLPRTSGRKSRISPRTRNMMIAGQKKTGGSPLSLEDLMQGAKNIEKFTQFCEAGFAPSDSMSDDATEKIITQMNALADNISPTKALATMHARYLANLVYQFVRFSCLAFGEKHAENHENNKEEYNRMFARFLGSIRASLGAATFAINIPADQIPQAFRDLYKLPPGDMYLNHYVLALIPEAEEQGGFGSFGGKFYVSDSLTVADKTPGAPLDATKTIDRELEDKVKKKIIKACLYDVRRAKNNRDALSHLRGDTHDFKEDIEHRIEAAIRRGDLDPHLSHHTHFHMREGAKETRNLQKMYKLVVIKPYAAKDKKAKDDE